MSTSKKRNRNSGKFRNPVFKKTISLITLGCPKNQVDSEFMAGYLKAQGLKLVKNANHADVIIINTCAFIEDAKQESIDTILEALRYKGIAPGKEVVVWGCLSERYRGEIEREIPEVDGYFGIESFEEVGRFLLGSDYRSIAKKSVKRILTTPSHVAYLKIAEGCDHQCTFCAIPHFKGRYRSRTPDSLIHEATALALQGVRELILIAQDTTRYGMDLSGENSLPDLLQQLARIRGIEWIRIMYAHPNHVSDRLIEIMAQEEKICKYIDMPLQHISDSMLKAMGRGGSRSWIETLIRELRRKIPGLVLRTAFIVGFPGESDDNFEELHEFIRKTRFERLGAFIYSPEEGTQAFSMGSPVSRETAEFRYGLLTETQQQINEDMNQQLVDSVQKVIIDEWDRKENLFIGRTQGDSPDVDQYVWIEGRTACGLIEPVRIESAGPYDLRGHVESGM